MGEGRRLMVTESEMFERLVWFGEEKQVVFAVCVRPKNKSTYPSILDTVSSRSGS